MTANTAAHELMQNGLALSGAGNLTEAAQCFRALLEIEPEEFRAAHMLGACLRALGQKEEALGWIRRVTEWQPDIADFQFMLATIYLEVEPPAHAEAEATFRRAIALDPTHRAAHAMFASMLFEQKRKEEARQIITVAAALPFTTVTEAVEVAAVLLNLEMHDFIPPCLEPVLKEEPDHLDALLLLATAKNGARMHGEAEALARRLLVLDGPKPQHLRTLGDALVGLERHDEAASLLEDAMAGFLPDLLAGGDMPGEDWLVAVQVLAFAKLGLDDLEGAIALYLQIERLAPDDHVSRFNLSLALLKNGDLLAGWERYESRWLTKRLDSPNDYSTKPLWLGKVDPTGKTILIHWEQGLGDTIQFLRYALLVVAIGGDVILAVQDPLIDLLAPLNLPLRIVRSTKSLPEHDMQCPILSLPLAFETALDSIPAVPAYLAADFGRAVAWHGRLGMPRGLRVGLAWSGNPRYPDDRRRSLPLETLRPLLDVPGIEFVCLQKEIQPRDLALARSLDMRVFGSSLTGFEETAALIENMDLVISVDTAIAHLAGAMGKPLWILNGYPSDWRWMLDRRDTPWYPAARLYRRTRTNTWADVIAEVAHDLGDTAQLHRTQLAEAAAAAAALGTAP